MPDAIFNTAVITFSIAGILTVILNFLTTLIFFNKQNRRSLPKLLLGNIAVMDIILIFAFAIPHWTLIPLFIHSHPSIALLVQSLANYLTAFVSYAQSFTMTYIS